MSPVFAHFVPLVRLDADDRDTVRPGCPPNESSRHWWNSPGKMRAVVLIHGLFVHPFSKTNVSPRSSARLAETGLLARQTAGGGSGRVRLLVRSDSHRR